MGRKRRGGAEALPRLLLLLSAFLGGASSNGEVGCLFSKNLCKPEIETCFNDLAFGRCILIDAYSPNDVYQYNLEPEELELLRLQLERLEFEGFKWPHLYTQCVMRILLDDLRYRLSNDVERLCRHLKSDEVLDDANGVVVKDGVVDPERVAIVKFMPSELNPHGEYADEFYYPPDMRQRMAEERMKAEAGYGDYDEGFLDKLASIDSPDDVVYRRGSRSLSKKSLSPSPPQLGYPDEEYGAVPREYVEALREFLERESGPYDAEDELEFLTDRERTPSMDDYAKMFARKYKIPREPDDEYAAERPDGGGGGDALDGLAMGPASYGDDEDDGELDEAAAATAEEEEEEDASPEEVVLPVDWKQEQRPPGKAALDAAMMESGVYSEGGTILPLGRDVIRPEEYEGLPMDLDSTFWRREMSGFKRRERLDVKKPGPLFSTNNYAFKTQPPPTPEDETSNEDVQDVEDDKDYENLIYSPQSKKEVLNSKLTDSPKSYANVDLDHVYIQFNQEFNTWSEGERVVNLVGSLIGLKPKELKEIRVDLKEVTFKVPKNSKNYNATDVVNKIDEIRMELQKQLNIEVVRAGIGDKTKLPAMLEVTRSPEISSSMFGALVAAGVGAVTAAAIVILIIARRHAKSRAKLAGLRTPDPEASKDYQELCRARMQAKQSDKLSESPKAFDFGRLIESGRSESNRSSTSSWSEEPQASNMDVSTGHLVLSYMEDHLKNQEKLDEEWSAISAYEAEPCSTAIAEAEGNSECNRPGAALPYDHSRVILNDLANLNNSDYINASTITDHDPRNPAYIATQGPLPQTAADFWQLVWEQGSVVIVMLTRLTEEGQAMCHRYWPDEGSELYHIYEVHLVSEHIWCDDYLVRSFYLKNMRTGETRTVTQFHFLSWPNDLVPKSTKALLEFRRKVNKSYRGRSCPIIVHCSDGAGRTGTYCLIDMVLNRMSKGAKEIDIAATLEHIRDQRAGMVATKQQYEFVLMAVAEEVHAILKSLPAVAEKPAAEKQQTASATKSDK